MRKTREFKLSICVVIWVFIFVFILHLAKNIRIFAAMAPASFMANLHM